MATTILLKRSLNTAIPGSLANGEPSFTANGDILFIGSNGQIVPIAGKRTPGTLTANQAIVVDSNKLIDTLMIGSATANAVINSSSFKLSNSTVTYVQTLPTAVQQAGAYYQHANGSWVEVATSSPGGANTTLQFNDSGVLGGTSGFTFNKTTNNVSLANSLTVGASVLVGANVFVNTSSYHVGNSTANSLLTNLGLDVYGIGVVQVANTTVSSNVAPGFVYVGSNTVINTSAYFTGSSSANAIHTSTGFITSNSTISSNLQYGQLNIGANSFVNSTTHFVGNSTANSVQTATQLSLANSTGTATLTPTTLTVQNFGGSQINTAANLSFTGANVSIPNANLAVKDLTVSGNLVVTGTVTSVDATNLNVVDPLIKLARNNAGTALDIGFYGQYNDGSNRFTGLAWDSSASVYELFANTTVEPTTTVDTGGVGYVRATLRTFLNTGALVSNSTVTNITANSTVSAAIVANTLTLSTALVGPSGGTGLASYSAEDILVANTTNGFRKLAFAANKVLQSNGTAVLYDDIDGGTF